MYQVPGQPPVWSLLYSGRKLAWVLVTARLLREHGRIQYGQYPPWAEVLAIASYRVQQHIKYNGKWD